jgi:hypothetical protein
MKITFKLFAGGVTHVVEHLSSEFEALGSITGTTKEKKEKTTDVGLQFMTFENFSSKLIRIGNMI